MGFVLNILYGVVVLITSPWLLWRYLRFGKNRRGWSQKLFGFVPRRVSDRPCIWFHAVSVGEVNLLAPVLHRCQLKRPDVELVVSTTTETGYDLARQKYRELTVFFFPMDFTWAVRNAIERIRPSLIVLAELEVWPNFIRGARVRQRLIDPPNDVSVGKSRFEIPLAIINGRLSESSWRGYQRLKWLLQSSFRRLNLVAAQNETYADRFRELGCHHDAVIVTGSVKYDGVPTDRMNEKTVQLRKLAGIQPGEFVFLAGSTQLEEDLLAARVYWELIELHPQLRLILAPRHPDRCAALVRALEELGLAVTRRSSLDSAAAASAPKENGNQPTQIVRQPTVLLIDVIGELGAWWGVADAAYVGGSMGARGGQNMIEPAAYGIPVSFGPHTKNFQTVVSQLLSADAATVVHDQFELNQFLTRALTDPAWAKQTGYRAQQEMRKHHGASNRTVEKLFELMMTPGSGLSRDR